MAVVFAHIRVWNILGLILSIVLSVCFAYGLYASYLSMAPVEQTVRYADLDALPRGLGSIGKLLKDRLQADSAATTRLVVYNYQGHTLYDLVRGKDSITIPAHITDTVALEFHPFPADVTEWKDSLHYGVMALDKYLLDYRRIIARYDRQVSRIEWNSFDTIPIYIISLKGHDEPIYIDASTPYVKPFYLSKEQVDGAFKAYCHTDSVCTELLKQYDEYYMDFQNNLTLPVWKTIAKGMAYYTNPRTGNFAIHNIADRWEYLRHHAFNNIRYKLFAKHPERWQPTLWGSLTAGLLLSFCGVVKAMANFRRKEKKHYEEDYFSGH